jgi:O-6-methylguanine DNA methyltransferase
VTRARQDARSFQEAVLGAVARVPAGRVATYGDIAALAGRARAARAVGGILAASTRPGLPYHRVVAAGGHLGGFGSGPAFKAALLLAEGLVVRRGRIQGFERHRWPARNALGRRSV